MRDAERIHCAVNLAVSDADESIEIPNLDALQISITFSPQTAFVSEIRCPCSIPTVYTPLRRRHDGSSESHITAEASIAEDSVSLKSSSKHQPQHTPLSTSQSPDYQESVPTFESRDFESDFSQTSDDTFLDNGGFDNISEKEEITQGGLVQQPDGTNDDAYELFRDIFAASYDCLTDPASSGACFDRTIHLEPEPMHKENLRHACQTHPTAAPLELEGLQESAPNKLKRKRQRFGSVEREKVKQVRKEGACLRCRRYEEKVAKRIQKSRAATDLTQYDLEVPCGKCCEVSATAKIFKQPCEKLSLQEVVVFRGGNSRAGQIRSTFPKMRWSFDDRQIYTIQITQDFINPTCEALPVMTVTCRRFLPTLADVLIEPYEASDGEILTVTSPPYACFDIDAIKTCQMYDRYVDQCLPFAENEVESTIGDDLIRLGFQESKRFARIHKDSPVSIALKIQACVHIAVKQPIMTNSEILGIRPVENPKFSIHGKAPIPSVIDYQLDTLMIHYMQRHMKEVIKRLKNLIFAKNPTGNWFEIFLTIFVLMCTLEHVYMAQIAYLRRSIGLDGENFANINFVTRHMIEEWKASAKNLLYHFRCVSKAMIPFSLSWTPDCRKQANLDSESQTYIRQMAEMIKTRKPELAKLRLEGLDNPRAQPLVWLLELFVDD